MSHCDNKATGDADMIIIGWKCTLPVRCLSCVHYLVSSVNLCLCLSLTFSEHPSLSVYVRLVVGFSVFAVFLCRSVSSSLLVTLRLRASIKAFNFSDAQCFQSFSGFTLFSPMTGYQHAYIKTSANMYTKLPASRFKLKG